jgi:hypothetical protein
MTGKEKRELCRTPIEKSGTRDAVETAIDRVKGDKSSTWEGINARTSKKIARWQAKENTNGEKGENLSQP